MRISAMLRCGWVAALLRRFWLACLYASLLCGLPVQAAPELLISDGDASLKLWPVVSVRFDPQAELTVDEIVRSTEAFEKPRTSETLGLRTGSVWLHIPLRVDAGSDGHWILNLDYHPLQRMDVYLVSGDQHQLLGTIGSLAPGSDTDLKTLSHALPVNLNPGQSHELLLRVETSGAMILPLRLDKAHSLLQHSNQEHVLQGLLSGLGLTLLIYSLLQWFSLRDTVLLHYALMIGGGLLFSLHVYGVGSLYLWHGNPWMEAHVTGLSSLMATCGGFLFVRQMLLHTLVQSRVLQLMLAGAALTVPLALAHALDLLGTRTIAMIITVVGPLPGVLGMPFAWKLARRKNPIGSTLLLAWLLHFSAVGLMIGVIHGRIPVNFWTLHSFEFGAAIEMVLFMHVLSLRARSIREAVRQAQADRDTMHSLAHTDPLTGLLNRRGLQAALTDALPRSHPHSLLTVYMLDLDGFKPVNDRYGHDVGDDLLVAVARRLKGNVRGQDVVARLGGDEFVVMSTQLASAEEAHALGLKLLNAFDNRFSIGQVQIQVGTTVGYAMAPWDASDAHDLLKYADSAMYAGKQAGKHCVRRHAGPPATGHHLTLPSSPAPER